MHSRLVGPALCLLLLAGCGGGDNEATTPPESPSSSTAITTLSPLPYPEEPPPSGRLIADMRQSSIDVSLGRMQVWIDNDTTHDVTPTRIAYRDPRLAKPLLGDNLRTNPEQSERGYPLYLPEHPPCPEQPPGRPESGTLEVTYSGKVDRIPVTDPTDVVGRFLSSRCEEIALAEAADLQWSTEVPDDGTGKGAIGTLTLLIRPTGVPGHTLVIDQILGSHLLSYAEGQDSWAPGLVVRSEDPPTHIDLTMRPSRCDGHAFSEGGNATAWRVGFTLDGKPGEILLRMSPEAMGNAMNYALRSCGLD